MLHPPPSTPFPTLSSPLPLLPSHLPLLPSLFLSFYSFHSLFHSLHSLPFHSFTLSLPPLFSPLPCPHQFLPLLSYTLPLPFHFPSIPLYPSSPFPIFSHPLPLSYLSPPLHSRPLLSLLHQTTITSPLCYLKKLITFFFTISFWFSQPNDGVKPSVTIDTFLVFCLLLLIFNWKYGWWTVFVVKCEWFWFFSWSSRNI